MFDVLAMVRRDQDVGHRECPALHATCPSDSAGFPGQTDFAGTVCQIFIPSNVSRENLKVLAIQPCMRMT